MKSIKTFIGIMVFFIFIIPVFAFAEETNEYVIISETTKYYKTVNYVNSNSIYALTPRISSQSFEISESEYNSTTTYGNISLNNYSGTIETTYKKMTTTISTNGNYYRYKVVLLWKNMPATRSYDNIGIGFLGSVKVKGSLHFEQYYCSNSNGCTTITTNYPQIFNYGAGTTFKIPTGDLYSLKQTLYFDVEKNTTSTIVLQEAYGDYSHATSNISLTNAKKYSVISNVGIDLNSSVENYYDSIPVAKAGWEGSW